MFKIVRLVDDTSVSVNLFVSDTETGNTAKDILTVPGAFDTTFGEKWEERVQFSQEQGTIGGYATACFALVISNSEPVEDLTPYVSQVLTVPTVAAQSLLSGMSEDMRSAVEAAQNALQAYEAVSKSTRVCVPKEAFKGIPEDVVSSMVSSRKSYSLKGTDNQEIFQKSFDSEFGITLPSLEDIHTGDDDGVSALDVLRVTMPYRKAEGRGAYSYRCIYHTPYYRVDDRLRGMVPQDIAWLNGHSVNDLLDIQPHERRMYNNLYTLVCADNARYVVNMISRIFFNTQQGSLIARFCNKMDYEALVHLHQDIKSCCTEGVKCDVTLSDVDELHANGWVQSDVVNLLRKKISFEPGYLREMLVSLKDYPERHTVESDTIPFTLTLTDEEERDFTELLISMGFISSAMQRFLVGLCKKAYRVNWGHTGATQAIPGFMLRNELDDINKVAAAYLADIEKGTTLVVENYPGLFVQEVEEPDEEDSFMISDGDASRQDEASMRMDYYVTIDTMQKIKTDSLSYDYFSSKATAAQTSEAAIVEYWRNVNGEHNLETFLSGAFLKTADVTVFIECFIKLMRWGELKPKLLVLQNHKEIRHVFDLTSGLKVDNTVIVDESTLVKHNGCDYSLKGFLYSDSNQGIQPDHVVGFLLEKNYGTVQKKYLASWVDLGEIVESGSQVIGDFAALTQISINPDTVLRIEDFAKEEHLFYLSDSNIEEGLKLKVQPKDLSAVSLLTTPEITKSVGYLKSLRNEHIITAKDRQYDTLTRYIKVLNNFYTTNGAAVNGVQNTVELAALAQSFIELWKSNKEGKVEANAAVAASTLSRLDLGANQIVWDETSLEGHFYLIHDMDLKSVLPPINFTDRQVRDVAAKVRNRVVLLLLQKDGKFIFCRKDLLPIEVMRVPSKKEGGAPTIGNKKYADLASVVDGLLAGRPVKINGVPAVLHSSLREFI